ncbi:MAG TPA: SUMF1/EgtB/PvdO family nonheme iron enzyme [Verrucomicrobiae bacterium]|nr:SUMF1/EgtB/PvdO family nonheme iron enzyme [Verrucomicrobiae bacterium]
MTKPLLPLLALSLLASAQPANRPVSGKRYALLIGNSVYKSLPPIASVPAEMTAMQLALADAHFNVTALTNATKEQYGTAVQNLPLQPGDTFFFYFSGYTVEGNGDNYLLPVDVNPAAPGDLPPLFVLQTRVGKLTRGLKIFMIEGPHALDTPIAGYTSTDLLPPDPSQSQEAVFAFASRSNPVVKREGVGWFTQAVVDQIRLPGSGVLEVFDNAKAQVTGATQSEAAPQLPFVDNSLTPQLRSFYFHDPVAPPPPPRPTGESHMNSADLEEYVWIPPGKFLMGCVPGDTHCEKNEEPQHEVTISKGFWMGRNEVKVLSWLRLRAKLPGHPTEDRKSRKDYPMFNVSWNDANNYCKAAGGRLPREAEWEYAARAGVKDQIYGFDVATRQANYAGTPVAQKIEDRRTPVRSFLPNAWNLYDMAGNVWEWVNDLFDEKYYSEVGASVTDPEGPKKDTKVHVVRGGGFDDTLERKMRISYRGSSSIATNVIGFRCVLEDTPATNKLLGLDSH